MMMDALKKSDGADTGLFSRYTMAGWVFIVVLPASMWQSSPDILQEVYGLLTTKDASGVAVAVIGVIAGLATAPAFGFVLATTAEGIWTLIDGAADYWAQLNPRSIGEDKVGSVQLSGGW